jgi:hypothetical protein
VNPEATSQFEGVPEPIVELCRSLSDFVQRSVGIRPDFQPETLPIVDHYIEQARRTIEGRDELVDLTGQAIGAYFGEVVRRSLAGFWRVPTPNFHDWQLCGEVAFFSFNPIGIGYEVLTMGTEHGGPSGDVKLAKEDRDLVHARLVALPPERESSYYSLSTRYEVIEIIAEAVRGLAESRGYSETTYSISDYGGELSGLLLN